MDAKMYCSNCGAVEVPIRNTPGRFGVEAALWLCFLIPGLIYSVWRLATRHDACPECYSANILPVNSPRAQEALRTKTEAG